MRLERYGSQTWPQDALARLLIVSGDRRLNFVDAWNGKRTRGCLSDDYFAEVCERVLPEAAWLRT